MKRRGPPRGKEPLMEQTTKTYKCPSCNAPLYYDGRVGVMSCDYCGAEIDAAYFLDEETFDEEAARSWEKYGEGKADWGEEDGARLFTCTSCGGEIVCDGETAATVCPYCDSPTLLSERLTGAYRPDLILPFAIDEKEAKGAMAKFCRGKFLLPSAFRREHKMENLKGLFLPYWLFDCKTNSRLTYSATRKFTWRMGDYMYTKTSYYRLVRSGFLDFDSIPVDAAVKMDNTMQESLEPFPIEKAVPYSDTFLAGHLANRYDDSAEHCGERAKERVVGSVEAAMRTTTGGYLTVIKTGSDVCFTESNVKYALFPVWFLQVRYRDKTYPFAINGQTGKMSGKLPISPYRFAGLLAGITAVVGGLLSLLSFLL